MINKELFVLVDSASLTYTRKEMARWVDTSVAQTCAPLADSDELGSCGAIDGGRGGAGGEAALRNPQLYVPPAVINGWCS